MARSPAKTARRRNKAAEEAQPVEAVAVAEPVVAAEETAAEAQAALADVAASTAVLATCVLASSCSIKEVAALRGRLGDLIQESAPVTIDASAVERIDTATLQLLFAFVRDRLNADREIVWTGVTASLDDAARLLGMRDLLCLPAAA